MLRLRRAELERQVDDNRHRVAQIDARLRLIESEYEMSAQEIVVKHVEPMRIAALSDLIEPDVPEPSVSDEALRVYAGFAVTGDAPGLQIVEMPAAEVASVIHRGPMEGIGQADWANRLGRGRAARTHVKHGYGRVQPPCRRWAAATTRSSVAVSATRTCRAPRGP
jgi:hypothetical protein